MPEGCVTSLGVELASLSMNLGSEKAQTYERHSVSSAETVGYWRMYICTWWA